MTKQTTIVVIGNLRVKVHIHSSEKSLKGKNLLPLGANSFFLELTPFQKRGRIILTEIPPSDRDTAQRYCFPFSFIFVHYNCE